MYNRSNSECPKSGRKLPSVFDGHCTKFCFLFRVLLCVLYFAFFFLVVHCCTVLSVNEKLNYSILFWQAGQLIPTSVLFPPLLKISFQPPGLSSSQSRLQWPFGLLTSATDTHYFLSHQVRSSYHQKSDIFSLLGKPRCTLKCQSLSLHSAVILHFWSQLSILTYSAWKKASCSIKVLQVMFWGGRFILKWNRKLVSQVFINTFQTRKIYQDS